MADPAPIPRRRWLRVSVRSLLLLLVAVAVPLAWKVNRVRNQRIVAAEVKKLNGQLNYDWEWKSPRQYGPSGPNWLKNLLGHDYFTDIVFVDLHDPEANDDTLASIASLPHLAGVQILSENVSDTGLLHLARAKHLTFLQIGSKKLTETGFAHLTGLKSLNKLSLILAEPQITDANLSHIANIKQLAWLSINATNVSSDSLARIVKLPKLIILDIDSPFITDADLELLKTANELLLFSLNDANVTDAGLTHLAKMTRLSGVTVSGTRVTAEGESKLRNALANCVVNGSRNPGPSISPISPAVP